MNESRFSAESSPPHLLSEELILQGVIIAVI